MSDEYYIVVACIIDDTVAIRGIIKRYSLLSISRSES